MELKELMDYRRYLKVAHHMPGRIRIKFSTDLLRQPEVEKWIKPSSPGATTDMPIVDELAPLLSGKTVRPTMLPGIENVRLNFLGRSIAIQYDAAAISPQWIEEAFVTTDPQRFTAMAEELIARFKN